MFETLLHYASGIVGLGYNNHHGGGTEGAMTLKAAKAGKIAHAIKASKSTIVHHHKKPIVHHKNPIVHHKKPIVHHHKKPIVHHKKPIVAANKIIVKKKPIVPTKKLTNIFKKKHNGKKKPKSNPKTDPVTKPNPHVPVDPTIILKIIAAYALLGVSLSIGSAFLQRRGQQRQGGQGGQGGQRRNNHQHVNPLNPANQTELPQIVVDDDAICGVCLNNITSGQYICRFPCGHVYHYHNCARRWLHREATCPTCRSRVNRFDRSEAVNDESDSDTT